MGVLSVVGNLIDVFGVLAGLLIVGWLGLWLGFQRMGGERAFDFLDIHSLSHFDASCLPYVCISRLILLLYSFFIPITNL